MLIQLAVPPRIRHLNGHGEGLTRAALLSILPGRNILGVEAMRIVCLKLLKRLWTLDLRKNACGLSRSFNGILGGHDGVYWTGDSGNDSRLLKTRDIS